MQNSDKKELERRKREKIVYTCARKCVEDFSALEFSAAEKICFARCTFKFLDACDYGAKVASLLEKKVLAANKSNE